MGIHLRRGNALMAEQGLEVHPFRPSVEPIRVIIMTQFLWGNLLFNAGLLEHPPEIGAALVGPLLCPLEISAQFLALTVFPGLHLLRFESAHGRRLGIETTGCRAHLRDDRTGWRGAHYHAGKRVAANNSTIDRGDH